MPITAEGPLTPSGAFHRHHWPRSRVNRSSASTRPSPSTERSPHSPTIFCGSPGQARRSTRGPSTVYRPSSVTNAPRSPSRATAAITGVRVETVKPRSPRTPNVRMAVPSPVSAASQVSAFDPTATTCSSSSSVVQGPLTISRGTDSGTTTGASSSEPVLASSSSSVSSAPVLLSPTGPGPPSVAPKSIVSAVPALPQAASSQQGTAHALHPLIA